MGEWLRREQVQAALQGVGAALLACSFFWLIGYTPQGFVMRHEVRSLKEGWLWFGGINGSMLALSPFLGLWLIPGGRGRAD